MLARYQNSKSQLICIMLFCTYILDYSVFVTRRVVGLKAINEQLQIKNTIKNKKGVYHCTMLKYTQLHNIVQQLFPVLFSAISAFHLAYKRGGKPVTIDFV